MNLQTTVWLVRHAETASPHVFHGAESDIELGEHGKLQAQAAGPWFAQEKRPTVVVSSHMLRARQTAQIVADHCGIPHHIANNLYERKVGALGGTSFVGNEGPWPETVKKWSAGEVHHTTSGAESYFDLVERLIPAFNAVVNEHRGKRIVLITHGIVCKVLLLSLLPKWGPTAWTKLGNVYNLAVSEISNNQNLSPTWQEGPLQVLPPGVVEVNEKRLSQKNQVVTG
jgi:2,3-bisphosphoglycerate-dependent phosphoglycerate mutase